MPDAQIYVQDYVRPEKVRSQSTSPKKHVQKLGDPTALGLSAFATCVMISALYNLNVLGITKPNVIVGASMFTGGVVQFAAGMWCFRVGSTFGGTGFGAFGGFWLSYGAIFIPAFGILDAFQDDKAQFQNAIGVYLSAWTVFTVIFTLACMRTNAPLLGAFIFLSITLSAETIYNFYPNNEVFIKFAGVTGMLTATCVWYCLAAVLLTPDLTPVSLPLFDLSRKEH